MYVSKILELQDISWLTRSLGNPAACPAGSDGLHPAALGEFQIAKAFADTLLQGFGWPGTPFTVPSNIAARACPAPSNVVARPSPCGITVDWDPVDGAYGYVLLWGKS